MTKHLIPSSRLYTKLKLASPAALRQASSANQHFNDDYIGKILKKKHQHVNYSSMAEQQPNSSYYAKKRTDLSESKERLTTISYFYADPEIDKATERPLTRLNPMTMMYMGVSDDNSHLLRSANYLRNELPTRLAHMIKELRNLPFIVACHPSILEIHERCIKTFRQFDRYDTEIKNFESEKAFNNLVFNMLEMNKDLLALLCEAFKDTRRYITNESFIKAHLNKILSTRLGLRLLCEHHLALNKQSNLHKSVLSNDIIDMFETKMSHSDNFYSTYLPSNSGDSASSMSARDDQWVGIIHQKFSPKKLIDTSAKLVTKLCAEKYGVAPKVKIDGHINSQFPYAPLPLEYIMPELLKNSFRATAENHRLSSSLPDVCVTIAVNEKDFIFRIRDRGGGIPHSLEEKIFDYHFSTADEGRKEPSGAGGAGGNGGDGLVNDCMNPSGFGMMCQASGLAVMHGYGFGLPTSKAYAEYLGGSLSFQSMQGIGCDFYLRLSLFDIEPQVVRI